MTVTQDASHPHARRFSADEQRRLAAMRRYEIVDSPRDSTFGMIASLAGRIIDAPMATVPIVVSDRLSFKPAHGLKNIGVTSRNQGRSASAVVHWEPYSVSSNRTDLRAASHRLVQSEPVVRFYAAAAIITVGGHRLGIRPGSPARRLLEALENPAVLDMNELERRLSALRTAASDYERRRPKAWPPPRSVSSCSSRCAARPLHPARQHPLTRTGESGD